ncbi:transmembrane protein 94-like isoform X2 [Argiope bruennichi]|uniref:transmembrane protein 94-like isoform X2 n=1 Tax=Argiope bruennichi TaxID=94029 RepID=UPI002495195D|nr:transmembrane protein 94-like isoform X2 [Argiope bruennichi]
MTSEIDDKLGGDVIGLTNKEAIKKLRLAIEEEVSKLQSSSSPRIPYWVRDAFYHRSYYAIFAWTSIVAMSVEIFLLLIYQIYGDHNFRVKSITAEIFFLVLFLIFNVVIAAWDSRLRHTEMHFKVKSALKLLEENENFVVKNDQQYSLHTPQSPCISQQWTYRDGQLLNLPCSLLVDGDVILMRPGHVAPGYCMLYNKDKGPHEYLKREQVFAPLDEDLTENITSPRLRKPACATKFIMKETPLIRGISLAMENALKKPITVIRKEYHAVVFYYIERIALLAVLLIILCIGSIRAVYFNVNNEEWAEHLLLRPVLVTLPLIPITLPICWILLNAVGNSYLLAIINCKQCLKPIDPFDEMEELPPTILEKYVNWSDLKCLCCSLLLGRDGYLWRSANLLQVLGSVTALCCVDKKGILSWPNPTPEKVFFLKSPKSKSNSETSTHTCADSEETNLEVGDSCSSEEILENKKLTKLHKRLDVKDHIYHPGSQVEVLDLTHNLHSPFGIQFDDPNWKFYTDNLKPLGLGILLNTCNPKAQEHYTKFSDHIACESLYNESAVPVVNKRCLCELAKQIGFTDSVVDFYELVQQIGIFRHVHPEIVQKGKLARSLNFPRLKMPFPNMTCAILKDLHRGSNQLFSQGTADLILDACNEYWDGGDIRVLTESDRKRILDFYHRSSLTAHCMGYAYSPLNNNTLTKDFNDMYIELPAEGYNLFSSLEVATSSPRSWDPPCVEGCSHPHSLNRYLSSDSLILSEQEKKVEEWNCGANSYLRQLGNEIFIGMVTMQYQACPDFVQLIEQLDKACIRFVHFSKENELRSRVFSEKMGLESGWNCHISLLSDETSSDKESNTVSPLKFSRHYIFPGTTEDSSPAENRTEVPLRHASAPSIINVDSNATKCEEISNHLHRGDSVSVCNMVTTRTMDETHILFEDENPIIRHKKSVSSLQDIFGLDESNVSHSPSHITESTDQSAPVTFDMSNRAKLPKGTENIRPHIEHVDNVPLQVSLFTDCTATATREMICIMQEYGEVVCCLGSSANSLNMPIFLQADASIAIEPLLPHLCIQQAVPDDPEQKNLENLSSVLNSLPCGIFFHRDDPISLYHLIMEARHYMCNMRNGLEFLLCSYLCLALLQMFAVIFFLPLALPLAHMLWLMCIEIPLLSLSLLGNPPDPRSTMLATGKNVNVVNRQAILFFTACFCAKFCPSVIVSVFSFACIMSSACKLYLESDAHICWVSLDLSKTERKFSTESWFAALTVSQNVISFFLIIYFVFISMGFIHRSHLLWKSNPFENKYWVIAALSVICLHLLFNVTDIALHVDSSLKPIAIIEHIPYYIWLLCALWPFILLPINELVRHHEIKVNVRQQKRARLEFCTKLGMNSPF